MRYLVLGLPLAIGLAAAIGCGSASQADEQPLSFGDSLGDGPCKTDADCTEGQTCRTVRMGELDQRLCVPLPNATKEGETSSPPPGATPDAGSPPPAPFVVTDAGAAPDAIAPPDGGSLCSAALAVKITDKGPFSTCGFNSTVEASSPATLKYVCPGDGDAQVTFGAQIFSGEIKSGVVTVQNVQTYAIQVPNTGTTCSYVSTQTITGTLASGTLAYDYKEALAQGQPAICKVTTAACYQSGPVTVTPIP